MVEPIDIKETPAGRSSEYLELVSAIDKDPKSPKVWQRVIDLAKSEEGTGKATKGFYGRIPLDELIVAAQRLKSAKTTEEKYKILSETASTGALWYDIALGHVNDKSLVVLGKELGKRKWGRALDIGSGTGNSLVELKKHAQTVVGLDRLNFLLDVARSRPELSGVALVPAEGLEIPFASESFDLVIAAGMTYYLEKDELPIFVAEVARVLKPGGSYTESFIYGPREGETLPFVEREYLESGKAVLACLMDRLISHQEEEPGPSTFSISVEEFKKQGFKLNVFEHPDEGALVLELRKKYPEPVENLGRFYLMGETRPAQRIIDRLIYGQETREVSEGGRYSRRDVIEDGLLPAKVELIKILESVLRISDDQGVIEANSLQEFFGVFVEPVVPLVTNEVVDPEVKRVALNLLLESLERLHEGGIRKRTLPNWDKHSLNSDLERLLKELEGKPGCERVISQAKRIISEISV